MKKSGVAINRRLGGILEEHRYGVVRISLSYSWRIQSCDQPSCETDAVSNDVFELCVSSGLH